MAAERVDANENVIASEVELDLPVGGSPMFCNGS
ncbi:hypothetical protein FP2506_10151 [Fulvimarina pelagi HTCC2506]|uniref:Uncharacterized protein n=1 Tax=Fulvimarina pelagi HTCC2506 TaxID=314231 RepID=Q0G566_9HYPH|nr:hypothetical protein FP2506_10151 [Fulvimarina pelagi HTCC2506]